MKESIFTVSRKRSNSPRDLINFIHLRAALPSDDLAVAELLTKTFLSTYEKKLPLLTTSDERKSELNNVAMRRLSGHVCVAELGYRIIGTFSLTHPESSYTDAWDGNGATLRCVAIHPDFHGLELSSLLLEEAERVARLWNCAAIYLHTQQDAAKVTALYEKFGYERDARGDKTKHGYKLAGLVKVLRVSGDIAPGMMSYPILS